MKKVDYKNKNTDELKKEIVETQEKLRLFRFGGSGSKSKNVKEGLHFKHAIARMMTVLNSDR